MEKTLDELANLGSLMTRGQLTQPRSVGPRIVGIAEEARATISRLTEERDAAVRREKYAISWANRSVDSVKEADDAKIAVLMEALAPFAELADEGNDDQPDDTKVTVQAGRSTCYGLTLADLRRARAAYATPRLPDADGAPIAKETT